MNYFGHLLCLFWTATQSSPTQWDLALSCTFGAFSLAPPIPAFVDKCVGVQGYKGSLFLSSITQPYHLLAHPPNPWGSVPAAKSFRQGCGDKSVLFYSIIGHLATSLHTIWAHFLDKSNKRHWLAGSDVRPSLLPHRQPRCC